MCGNSTHMGHRYGHSRGERSTTISLYRKRSLRFLWRCGPRSCWFYVYHTRPTLFFIKTLPPIQEARETQKKTGAKEKRRIARYHAPGIPLHYEISLASRKSTYRHPIPRASHPNHPPEEGDREPEGKEGGGREVRVTRPGGGKGEWGWIPHGFRTFQWNKARRCQPTCVGWVQRTSKATTPLPTLAERSPPSPLFYPLDPPPTYATLSPSSSLILPPSLPLALSPTSIPPNPLTTLPVDPIYVRSRVRSYIRSLYVPHVPRLHTSGT